MAVAGRVMVVGAGGVIGRLIVSLLRAELPEVEIIAASRRPVADLGVSHRFLDLARPDSFAGALHGMDVLIHAAGPFHHDPVPLVRACLDGAIHYVDIADDPAYVVQVMAAVEGAECRSAVVPGCSTVPELVSLLARRFAAVPELAAITVYLSMGSRNPVSGGLLASLLAPLGRPLPDGRRCFRRLYARVHGDGIRRRYGAYPFPVSHGIDVGGARIPVRFFAGFDRQGINLLLQGASYLLPCLSSTRVTRLVPLVLPLANICRRFGGEEGRLVIEARDKGGQVVAALEVVARRDGLRLTAAPAVWAASRLLAGDATGLRSLADLVEVDEAVRWIEAQGYEVIVSA